MTIQFQHPLNCFTGFDPSDVNHYKNLINVPGIYIYGLRLNIKGQGKKFVPMYVGIAEDLKKRLYDNHFKQENYSDKKTSKKEIFDFSKNKHSIKEIVERYRDMLVYDQVTNCGGIQRPTISYLKHLIWFQDLTFYNIKLGFCNCPYNTYKNDSNHLETLKQNGFLDKLHSLNPFLGVEAIKLKCIETKKQFDTDFYFVYATWDNNEIGKIKVTDAELATKKALNQIGIHTTAKANGDIYPMKIDLTQISNDLINLGGHPFDYSNLIIPIIK